MGKKSKSKSKKNQWSSAARSEGIEPGEKDISFALAITANEHYRSLLIAHAEKRVHEFGL